MSADPVTDYEGWPCALQPHWETPDEEGNLIAVTSEEWAELMAEVAEEQSRLEVSPITGWPGATCSGSAHSRGARA